MPTTPSLPRSYVQQIIDLLACSLEEARMIKVIMADDVLHTVALDWLTESQFAKTARQAAKLFITHRVEYEEYFAGTRAIFERDQAAQGAFTASSYEI